MWNLVHEHQSRNVHLNVLSRVKLYDDMLYGRHINQDTFK